LNQRSTVNDAIELNPKDTRSLKELRAELERHGLMEPTQLWRRKLLLWVPVFFLSYLGLVALPFGWLWLICAPLAALGILTMGYVGHDAGHYAISRKRWINDVWGQFAMTVVCGMSFGFWRVRHNRHHAHCQEVEGDPDMHFGFLFSVYPSSANWHTRLGRFFLRIQKWSFWPLASLYWVTLRYDAIRDLFQRPKETRLDRFLLPLHWILLLVIPGLVFGWTAALAAYVTMSCLSSLMTASVFIPNHIGMRHLGPDEKISYLEQQVTTSRNITNHRLLDFYYGGLNSQIEHHLFPRVPHDRYRAMRPIVRAFCRARGIDYQEASLYAGLATVGRHLGEMTKAFQASRRAQAAASTVEQPAPRPAAAA
jgi:fatty acid desaturase